MSAKDNPREQDRHEKDASDTGNNSMTTDDTPLRSELETILPGKAPLQNIHARHEGGMQYSVMSARDGGPRYYYVELGSEPTCTCPDLKYNRDQDDHEVCKHIVAAILSDRLPLDESLGQLSIEMMSGLNAAVERAERAATQIEDVRDTVEGDVIAQRDQQADSAAQNGSAIDDSLSPEEAQRKLEQALSNAGFEVHFIDRNPGEEKDIVFSIGHDDFSTLKEHTSQNDKVGYDGNNNRISTDDVAEYVGDL